MSAPTQSITVSISLKPPENTTAPTSLSSTSSHAFPLSIAPNAPGHAGYYAALRAALADARTKTGDELTQWRDAVGKNELGKEPKKNVTDEDEEEDEDEDEGENLPRRYECFHDTPAIGHPGAPFYRIQSEAIRTALKDENWTKDAQKPQETFVPVTADDLHGFRDPYRKLIWQAGREQLHELLLESRDPQVAKKCEKLLSIWKKLGDTLDLVEDTERKAYEREMKRTSQLCAWSACQYNKVSLGSPTRACAGCGEVRYCGRSCQQKDRKEGGHKKRCKRIKSEAHSSRK